jgi:hypothetical protein
VVNDISSDRPIRSRSRIPKFGRVPKDLLRDPQLSPNAKALYGLLDDIAGYETATMAQLGEWLGCSTSTIQRAVRELERSGWVESAPRIVNGQQAANEYVCNAYPFQADTRSPMTGGGVTHDRAGGVTHDRPTTETNYRDHSETTTPGLQQPLMGDLVTNNSSPRPRKDPQPDPDLSDFAEFWKLYPRRVGRGQAVNAWRKAIKKIPVDTILDAAKRYRDDPNLPETKFIPHPATWLNGERWGDDPLPARDGDEQPVRVAGYWQQAGVGTPSPGAVPGYWPSTA